MSGARRRDPIPEEDMKKVRWDRLKSVDLNKYVGKLGPSNVTKKIIDDLKKNLKMGRNIEELILNAGNIYENEERFSWLPKVIARHLVELRTLDLSTFLVSTSDLAFLSTCYALRILKLNTEFKYDGKWFTELCNNNPNLTRMCLAADAFDKECLDALPPSIRYLELSEVNVINTDALIDSIAKMHLRSLSFISVSNLGSDFLYRLADAAPHLEELKLTNTSQLKLEGIGKFRFLRSLLININDQNKDELFVLDLGLYCTNLEELEFYKVNKIPKHWFSFLANLRKLNTLKLRNIITISEGNFSYLKSIESLKTLEIYGCDDFTDEIAVDILRDCKNLTLLEITDCDNVKDIATNASALLHNRERESVITIKVETMNLELETSLFNDGILIKHPLLNMTVNGVEVKDDGLFDKFKDKKEDVVEPLEGTQGKAVEKEESEAFVGAELLNAIEQRDIESVKVEIAACIEVLDEIKEKKIAEVAARIKQLDEIEKKKEEGATGGADVSDEIIEKDIKKKEEEKVVGVQILNEGEEKIVEKIEEKQL